jgi:glucokinase
MRKPATFGIDIGGTKTLCLLVNKRHEVIASRKFKTSPEDGLKVFSKNLARELRRLKAAAKQKDYRLVAIGVGCAGTVDRKNCIVKTSPNMQSLEGFTVGKFLKEEFNTRVLLENDVHMGVWAEHRLGAAKGCKNVLGVFFGTGVGGAAIIRDELYRGSSGFGGQVGCILAQPVGGPQAALSHGMLDRIANKAAIASEAITMAAKNWAPYLHKKVGTDLAKIGWGVLKQAIQNGDERIEEMLRARMRVVGIALSNVVNFLNPDMVVLGGGLMEELPKLVLQEVEAGLRGYLVPEVGEAVQVKASALRGEAVALGAATAALDEWRS